MKEKLEKFGLTIPKLVLTSIFVIIGFASMIYVRFTSNTLFSYFYCLATVGFALLPLILCMLMRWNMNFWFYLYFSLYTMGPLVGAVYNVYYLTSWWDDLLHFMAGTVFAVVGARLVITLNKKHPVSYVFAAVFGILLSVGIAVCWEFYEHASDRLLNSDMQADTIVEVFNTKINSTDGSVHNFHDITSTIITTADGKAYKFDGYLDIGLYDTMNDLLVETLGALLLLVYIAFDRNKHPL